MNNNNDVEKTVNEFAKDYYYARKSGNKAVMDKCRNAIILKIYEPNAFSNKIVKIRENYNESSVSFSRFSFCGYDRNDAVSDLTELFIKFIEKYDYDKNPNFAAAFITAIKWDMNNKLSKDKERNNSEKTDDKEAKKRIPRAEKISDIVCDESGEHSLFEKVADESENIENLDLDNSLETMRIKLISVITLFYKRNKGKSASQVKYSYYRIFTTETVVKDIRENSNTGIYDFMNKNEIMQTLDCDYIKFIAFTDMEKLEDIISMAIKKYSDIINGAEDKIIILDKEPRVIIAYRTAANLDEKQVTAANVSLMKKNYKQEIEDIFKENELAC
ncbi:hypothetical protein [Ruminococcus sp. HUN007]|uniref:hypothetical protein n=1 Tax=Ruminococcus sp. HUN007 TaxID=1514668 RepID=UPI000A664F48|nr:hypothetical protein [Ruminococcus sp. HUN007]